MIEIDVVGVRIELPSNQPLILLKERDGERHLPIWIGAPEASAIAMSLQAISTPRPMTHDTMVALLEASGVAVVEVKIVDVQEAVFFARIVLSNGAEVDSRASDAVALALRTQAPLRCGEDVLEEAGVLIGEADDGESAARKEDQVREFREFLADIEPEDFER
ncbi:bifunctional nuclease family protein [Zhihengliuella flava]|uniref:Bifunctional DNase/RNase n=1 Tax=Zhihengliuella flava TaxID=1285193 RepID=A0A931GKP5_9MICC|nr:bifunctional nuclease family protein [Zhihengliuella flava]MBG6083704.1 bifunctional DNase/RNase [Zhihengliuella flava]